MSRPSSRGTSRWRSTRRNCAWRPTAPRERAVSTSNKTDSAVRITHIPTKTVVQCQNERSQLQNRETAMRMLRSKLLLLDHEKREQEMAREKGEQKEIGWGSQIRSYVLAPYTLVKDHRTNYEKGNVEAVLNGAIDDFIKEYIWQRSVGKLGVRSA